MSPDEPTPISVSTDVPTQSPVPSETPAPTPTTAPAPVQSDAELQGAPSTASESSGTVEKRDVTVSIGADSTGWMIVDHPTSLNGAITMIVRQPESGTASVELIADHPEQTCVKVVNSTPSTAQVVGVKLVTPAPSPSGTVVTEPTQETASPMPPAVVEGIVYRGRDDNDVLTGSFCRVINGEYQGRYGVFTSTATIFLDGWPAAVTVRTRDDEDEYITVNYADIRPANPGGR